MSRRFEWVLLVVTLNLALVEVAATEYPAALDSVPWPPSGNEVPTEAGAEIGKARLTFELGMIDKEVVREFEKAWWISNNGTNGKEGLVLIFRKLGGDYFAQLQHRTNEQRQVTFIWVPNAIAVVHTHPNTSDPKPSGQDKQIADKFNVPMFTITLHGMYVYDPGTKKTSLVHHGLDWLEPAKWKRFSS